MRLYSPQHSQGNHFIRERWDFRAHAARFSFTAGVIPQARPGQCTLHSGNKAFANLNISWVRSLHKYHIHGPF